MILTITREEVEKLIREKYNFPEDVKVLISSNPIEAKHELNRMYGYTATDQVYNDQVAAHTDTVPQMSVTVNKENQVQDIKEVHYNGAIYADTDSGKDKTLTERVRETRGIELHKCPKKLTKEELDAIYEAYADTVEQFLKSGKKEQFLDLEGYSASGIRYRYNTAIKMYGFDDQCYASATEHGKGKSTARLIRKDKVK